MLDLSVTVIGFKHRTAGYESVSAKACNAFDVVFVNAAVNLKPNVNGLLVNFASSF